MNHYIAYHNPDGMGYDVSEIPDADEACVVTGKSVAQALDGRVWLITGRGRPRRFTLVGTFIVDRIGPDDEDPTKNLVWGSTDRRSFEPEIPLNALAWFGAFKQVMGHFGLGFQRITSPQFIDGLERAAARGQVRPRRRSTRRR